MTITTDRRTELLSAAPLFAAMDADGCRCGYFLSCADYY